MVSVRDVRLLFGPLAAALFNLYAIADSGAFWSTVAPYYGILQRSLFAALFLWCAGVGFLQ